MVCVCVGGGGGQPPGIRGLVSVSLPTLHAKNQIKLGVFQHRQSGEEKKTRPRSQPCVGEGRGACFVWSQTLPCLGASCRRRKPCMAILHHAMLCAAVDATACNTRLPCPATLVRRCMQNRGQLSPSPSAPPSDGARHPPATLPFFSQPPYVYW